MPSAIRRAAGPPGPGRGSCDPALLGTHRSSGQEAAAPQPASPSARAPSRRSAGSRPGIVEIVATLTRRPTYEPGQQVAGDLRRDARADAVPDPAASTAAAEINEAVFHLHRDPRWPRGRPGRFAIAARPARAPQGARWAGGSTRPGGGRLVLVAAGAGFGAIWAIARAARYGRARPRDGAGGRAPGTPSTSTCARAWTGCAAPGVARIVLVRRPRPPAPAGRARRPAHRSPAEPCAPPTSVHVAGDVSTVGAVQVLAASVGAPLLSDRRRLILFVRPLTTPSKAALAARR